jgi:SHS2 domain-containing protein
MAPEVMGRTPTSWRDVTIKAPDRTSLLIDFLGEVLADAHIERQAYVAVRFQELTETSVSAKLGGVSVEQFEEDIKAVTYHEADVRQDEKGMWATMVVFDI